MTKYKIEIDKEKADELLYDLINNVVDNEQKADEHFAKLKDTKLNILHYMILTAYLYNDNSTHLEKLANDMQDYIAYLVK